MGYCQIPTFWAGISSAHLPTGRQNGSFHQHKNRPSTPNQKNIHSSRMVTWFSNRTTPSDPEPGIAEKNSARWPGYISRYSVKTENSIWKKSFKQNLQNSRKNLLHWQTIKEQTWKYTSTYSLLIVHPLWAEAWGTHTLSLEVFTPGFQIAGICPPQPVSASHRFSILIRNDRDNAWLFQIRILDILYRATG